MTASSESSDRPLIEIGWIMAGPFESLDREAAESACHEVASTLSESLPQYRWRLTWMERPEMVAGLNVEPIRLLEAAVIERDLAHWDSSIVVTALDLVSHYKDQSMAAISRSLEGAVLSTLRIDPRSSRSDATRDERSKVIAERLSKLALHALGHLFGLDHEDDPSNLMYPLKNVEDIDRARQLNEAQSHELGEVVLATADPRLEESPGFRSSRTLLFYLASLWVNRRPMFVAIREAKPWQFPFRLNRLMVAAVSAMLVMIMTAEVWDLALSQSTWLLVSLPVFSVVSTSLYVLIRQGLILKRGSSTLSEQKVLTNGSTMAIVFSGMLSTFAVLFLSAMIFGLVFFPESLISDWASSVMAPPKGAYARTAALIASLSMFLAGLGANFEERAYFKHVTLVDEEV